MRSVAIPQACCVKFGPHRPIDPEALGFELIEDKAEATRERRGCNFSGGRRDKRCARGQQALTQGMADVGI